MEEEILHENADDETQLRELEEFHNRCEKLEFAIKDGIEHNHFFYQIFF